ncbi:hypothetical protein BGX29_000200 [Mortierella sp. GBA35]|nr:hypothetical protein BGX29_000200 [Mortierella sp. GBA35]
MSPRLSSYMEGSPWSSSTLKEMNVLEVGQLQKILVLEAEVEGTPLICEISSQERQSLKRVQGLRQFDNGSNVMDIQFLEVTAVLKGLGGKGSLAGVASDVKLLLP